MTSSLRLAAVTCPSGDTVMNIVAHGKVNVSNAGHYGSVVVYECDEGYQIDGPPHTYCQGKTWRHGNVSPTCVGKSAPFHYSCPVKWCHYISHPNILLGFSAVAWNQNRISVMSNNLC